MTGDEQDIIEYIGGCLGSRIGKVTIEKWNDSVMHVAVSKLLDGINIDHLRIVDTDLTGNAV